jgi:hypothetical protein
MTFPALASLGTTHSSLKQNSVALSTVGKSLESTMGIQQTIRSAKESLRDNSSTTKQAFLQPNPYQSYFDQNPSAKTELKIDLDNFDMEYVLKVQ